MGFTIVEGEGRTFWAASDGSSTYYKGQLVSYNAAQATHTYGTVVPLVIPSAAYDKTLAQQVCGTVIGFNYRTPQYGTGVYAGIEKGVGVASWANQRAYDKTGQEGMYAKGDTQLLIHVAEILPTTMVRGNIYATAIGTAPTVYTLTAVNATPDGWVNAVTSAATTTPVANMGTYYCRSGNNMGMYRVNAGTSTTAHTVTVAFPFTEAIGDTFVYVPFKQGSSAVCIPTTGGPGMFIDADTAANATGDTHFNVFIYKLDLSTAGREYADFRFGGDHFLRTASR